MKVTLLNIDDVIREEKRKYPQKKLSFVWGKKEFLIFKEFYDASCPCVHGWFCLCAEKPERYPELEKDSKQGITFIGVKHYWDFKKKGYSVSY